MRRMIDGLQCLCNGDCNVWILTMGVFVFVDMLVYSVILMIIILDGRLREHSIIKHTYKYGVDLFNRNDQ